jgi:flagella basal body P-ring formation protein FlgA
MKIFAWFALQIVFLASLAQARPEVLFPSEAEISNGPSARLIEVAELKDFSPEAFAQMSKLVIWEAEGTESQKAGFSASIKVAGSELSKRMRDAISDNPVLKKANPSFKIPGELKLSFSKSSVSKSATERGLKNALLPKCPTCVYQIRISSVPVLATKTWSIDYDQEIKNGAFMLPVQDVSEVANQWVSGSYRAKNRTPVMKRAVRFGERVQAEDFELSEADVTFQRESSPQISELVGLIANRSFQPKTVAVRSDFKKEPAAHRGQVLKAIAGTDSYEVSINVTAEENGSIGDLIKIQNPETKKMMSGLIVDKGVVKVQ